MTIASIGLAAMVRSTVKQPGSKRVSPHPPPKEEPEKPSHQTERGSGVGVHVCVGGG